MEVQATDGRGFAQNAQNGAPYSRNILLISTVRMVGHPPLFSCIPVRAPSIVYTY